MIQYDYTTGDRAKPNSNTHCDSTFIDADSSVLRTELIQKALVDDFELVVGRSKSAISRRNSHIVWEIPT